MEKSKISIFYPILINLQRFPCLVIGGGQIALRKVQSLLLYKAKITILSPKICMPLKKLINLDDEETKNLTPQIKKEKAEAAGYNSWDEYKAADWKWRSDDDLTSSELIRRQRKNRI